MYESLLAAWPKKGDLWSQLLDLEIGVPGNETEPTAVRDIFERRTRVKGLKPQQAEKWFRRWATWEQQVDPSGKSKEKVMAKAQEWTKQFKVRKEAEATNGEDMEE